MLPGITRPYSDLAPPLTDDGMPRDGMLRRGITSCADDHVMGLPPPLLPGRPPRRPATVGANAPRSTRAPTTVA